MCSTDTLLKSFILAAFIAHSLASDATCVQRGTGCFTQLAVNCPADPSAPDPAVACPCYADFYECQLSMYCEPDVDDDLVTPTSLCEAQCGTGPQCEPSGQAPQYPQCNGVQLGACLESLDPAVTCASDPCLCVTSIANCYNVANCFTVAARDSLMQQCELDSCASFCNYLNQLPPIGETPTTLALITQTAAVQTPQPAATEVQVGGCGDPEGFLACVSNLESNCPGFTDDGNEAAACPCVHDYAECINAIGCWQEQFVDGCLDICSPSWCDFSDIDFDDSGPKVTAPPGDTEPPEVVFMDDDDSGDLLVKEAPFDWTPVYGAIGAAGGVIFLIVLILIIFCAVRSVPQAPRPRPASRNSEVRQSRSRSRKSSQHRSRNISMNQLHRTSTRAQPTAYAPAMSANPIAPGPSLSQYGDAPTASTFSSTAMSAAQPAAGSYYGAQRGPPSSAGSQQQFNTVNTANYAPQYGTNWA